MSVIVIGAQVPRGLDVADCVLLAEAAVTHFDNDTESWTVTAPGGASATARVVIDARPSADCAIAGHGVPNYFRIPGPDVRRQTRYVARCLRILERSGAARIEAKGRLALHRWLPRSVSGRFYLSGSTPGPDELYDGPATISVSGRDIAGRVRLTGHLDAIDGQYHWQGMLFEPLPDGVHGRSAGLTLTIDGRTVEARAVERTPWGTHMIAGAGAPPFGR